MMKPKPQPKKSSSSDAGFTIIESLVGIVIVAILLAAIAPVLVMSTAIRVQSRRIEKATQAANTFIDGIRTGSIAPPTKKVTLTAPTSTVSRTVTNNPGDYLINITQMPVPTATDTDLYYFQKTGIICKSSDSTCTKDSTSPFDEFYIQAARIAVTDTPNDGYRLAIRVYQSTVNFNQTLLASTGNSQKQLDSPVVASMGNRQKPLVERTVDIGNSSTTFQALCSRLGMAKNSAGNNQNCQ